MLSEKNKHPFDSRISFQKEGHKYWIDNNDENLLSCTQYIHKFFNDFDTDKEIKEILNSERYIDPTYKYYNMTYDEIKNIWEKAKDDACNLGTELHENIESFYNNLYVENNSYEFKQFIQFYNDHKYLEIYRTEWMIFSEELRITGSIDAIFVNPDSTLSIYDWKRSKKIYFNGYTNGKYPFEHIPDSNYYHYSLQLNLYRLILENYYGKKIKDMYLIILHPNNRNNKYKKIKVEKMDKECQLLIEYRKKELEKIKT